MKITKTYLKQLIREAIREAKQLPGQGDLAGDMDDRDTPPKGRGKKQYTKPKQAAKAYMKNGKFSLKGAKDWKHENAFQLDLAAFLKALKAEDADVPDSAIEKAEKDRDSQDRFQVTIAYTVTIYGTT